MLIIYLFIQTELLNPTTVTAIQTIGFPSVIAILLLGMIIYMVRTTNNRQNKNDTRYDELTNKSIENAKLMSEVHDNTLREIITELRDIKSEVKVVGMRVEEYTRTVEERSKLFIFNNQKNNHTEKR